MFPLPHKEDLSNRPRSVCQYSSMASRLSGQTSIFGIVFFVSRSLWGIERQNQKNHNFDDVRILIYWTPPLPEDAANMQAASWLHVLWMTCPLIGQLFWNHDCCIKWKRVVITTHQNPSVENVLSHLAVKPSEAYPLRLHQLFHYWTYRSFQENGLWV